MKNNEQVNGGHIKTDYIAQDSNKPDLEGDLKEDDKRIPNCDKEDDITNLGSEIENTENHLEDLNSSIMGDSIFDY